MSTESKKSRWNRLEIAFNEGKRPEAAALRKDWRENLGKTQSLRGLENSPTPSQANAEETPTPNQANAKESPTPGQPNAEESPTPNQASAEESSTPNQANAEENDAKTFATEKKTTAKRSQAGVRSLWEEARRSQADAAAKKRVDPASRSLKSAKLLKTAKLPKTTKLPKAVKPGESALEAKEFPFPRRPRTYRSSDPPRRFDDPRKD